MGDTYLSLIPYYTFKYIVIRMREEGGKRVKDMYTRRLSQVYGLLENDILVSLERLWLFKETRAPEGNL